MWKQLPYPKPFFLSCTTENGYRIYVTDYINVWWAHYTENDFLSLLKKSNDDLEMESDNQLLQLGLKMLLQPENLKRLTIRFENKALIMSMLMSCKFPFYLELKLIEGSKEMFYKMITQQLLKTVEDLKTSQNELRFLLIKKDKEIQEYKTETDVRLAMYLKTGVYCDEEHMGKHPMYENHFGAMEVSKCLLEKITYETEDQVIIKQENVLTEAPSVKVELDSQPPVKNEPDVSEIETQHLNNSGLVIKEIKCEPENITSAKKRSRKLLNI